MRSALAARHPVRRPAAGRRHRRRPPALGVRRRPRRLRPLRAAARALRHRAGLLHRPLPDAARLLRPRAQRAGVLDPVRRRGRSTSRSRSPWSRGDRRAGTAPALVLAYAAAYARRRRRSPTSMLSRRARRARDARRWCGSWCGCRSRPLLAVAAAGGTAYLLPRRCSTVGSLAARRVARAVVVSGSPAALVLRRRGPRRCGSTELTSMVDTITRRLPLPRRH